MCVEFSDKILIFAVLERRLLQWRVTEASFCFYNTNRQLMRVNQRLYHLSILQSSALPRSSLHLLFNALVIDKLTRVLLEYAGQLADDDKNRIKAISRKAMRICGLGEIGLYKWHYYYYYAPWSHTYCVWHRRSYWQVRSHFREANQPGHSLHHPMPPKTSTYRSYQFRKRQHSTFNIPMFTNRSLKIVLTIVVYLNMYNLPLATLCCVSLVFSLIHIVHVLCFVFFTVLFHFIHIHTLVTVCECHIEIKGYSLTYLLTFLLIRKINH